MFSPTLHVVPVEAVLVEVDAVIPLDVPVNSLDPKAQLFVPAVAVSTVGERRGDSRGYNGQNGHSKEHEPTQSYLLYSSVLLTVDKISGSPSATSYFGRIFPDQKYNSGASLRALTGLSLIAFLLVAVG